MFDKKTENTYIYIYMNGKYKVHQKLKFKDDENIIYKIKMIEHSKKHTKYTLENTEDKHTIKIKDTVIDDIFTKI